jgi:peptide/nickel transport system permease protein
MLQLRSALVFIVIHTIQSILLVFTTLFLVYTVTPPPADLPTSAGGDIEMERPSFTEWLLGTEESDGVLARGYGVSMTTQRPVRDLIDERLGATFELLIPSLAIGLVVGTLIGLFLAAMRRNLIDQLFSPLPLFLAAVPIFWLGIILMHQLGIERDTLPIGGRCSVVLSEEECGDQFDHLILPLLSLTIFSVAAFALYVRRAVLEYRAEKPLLFGLLNLPDLAVAPMTAVLLSGLIVVEVLFAWPGAAQMVIRSVYQLDMPVLVGLLVDMTLGTVAVFFIFRLSFAVVGALVAYLAKTDFLSLSVSGLPYPQAAAEDVAMKVWEARPRMWFANGCAILAGLLLIPIFGAGIFATQIYESQDLDPFRTSPAEQFLKPGEDGHTLGTDDLGRDQLARVLMATRNTLQISFAAALISLAIAVPLALFGGIPWGIIGRIINFFVDIGLYTMVLVPMLGILAAARISTYDMQISQSELAVLLGIFGWANVLPVLRERVQVFRERVRRGNLDILRDVLFEGVRVVGYALALNLAAFILLETALSFLGVGVMPPAASLGNILSNSTRYLMIQADLVYSPGIVITVTVFCLLLVAERLRDSFRSDLPAEEEAMVIRSAEAPAAFETPFEAAA